MQASAKNYGPSALLFSCMLCDVFIRPFYSAVKYNARVSLFAIGISLLITFLLCALAVGISKSGFYKNKLKLAYAALFILSAGISFVRTEQFYRYISTEAIPLFFIILGFITVAAYCSGLPQNALLRAGVAAAALCVLSVALIVISNIANFKVQNLSLSGNNEIIQAAVLNFNFAPEILLFFLMSEQENGVKLKSFAKVLAFTGVAYAVLTVSAELVMGQALIMQSQPAHTVSRLGGISVFKRLDTVFASLWILAAVIKFSAFFSFTAKNICTGNNKKLKFAGLCFIQIAAIGVAYFLPAAAIKYTLSFGTLALLLLSALIPKAKSKKKAVIYESIA